jgi:hypothetical protein
MPTIITLSTQRTVVQALLYLVVSYTTQQCLIDIRGTFQTMLLIVYNHL